MTEVRYNDRLTRMFLMATLFWAFIGMAAGLLLALQLADVRFNLGLKEFTFGRLRPFHTNGVIFAFSANAIFCGVYYSLQRLLKARLFSDLLGQIHFWGWQLVVLLGGVGFLNGITVGKEYAEYEWSVDILMTLIWVAFAVNFFGTLFKRREKHIYVAIWFYIATVVTIAVLHIVNSLAMPVSLTKSYPLYAGVQDALVQWWYGHNAVGFLLTTPFLGLMYYFLPKAAGRPIYSYRLSILHFWSLVFLYIWAGPHHLHYTALPDWAQSLGMVFSVMLLAPSWGGMVNGFLTLRGAWHKLRTDPVIKFYVTAITFYGMAVFEGSLMSIKSVNMLSHYTDWTVGHVHSGALGWVGFLVFGMIYWLVPRLWKMPLHSQSLAAAHFWVALVGILVYVLSMWVAGVTQGLQWKEFTADGVLAYPNFMDTVTNLIPLYWARALGGGLYLTGLVLMIYNIYRTVRSAPRPSDETVLVAEAYKAPESKHWHAVLEGKPMVMALCAGGVIAIGGLAELVPTFLIESNVPTLSAVKPYTPLELEGRDLYVREGCFNCHTQMIRPFRDEVARYGEYSKAGEFVYDRPHQWGSKRTGPDLHRLGGKYNHLWHLRHMEDPQTISPGSIMPPYPFLLENELDLSLVGRKMKAMARLGVPYSESEINRAEEAALEQARAMGAELEKQGAAGYAGKEIIALIAYLQRLGKDISTVPTIAPSTVAGSMQP